MGPTQPGWQDPARRGPPQDPGWGTGGAPAAPPRGTILGLDTSSLGAGVRAQTGQALGRRFWKFPSGFTPHPLTRLPSIC